MVIPIYGTITLDGGDSNFLSSSEHTTTDDIVKKIAAAAADPAVKGVLFEINSPGGSAVASKEIADAISALNKTKYSVIREVGASGAYWIASATDKIIAQESSVTGSVGVISSYLEFSRLFDKYGVTYERLTAGKYKDLGTPYKELTLEERAILEKKLAIIHQQFLSTVQKNRQLTPAQVEKIRTGEFFLGSEAKALHLIDAYGSKADAIVMLKKDIHIEDARIVEAKPKGGLLSYLTQTGAYSFGKGFGASIAEHTQQTATKETLPQL